MINQQIQNTILTEVPTEFTFTHSIVVLNKRIIVYRRTSVLYTSYIYYIIFYIIIGNEIFIYSTLVFCFLLPVQRTVLDH